MSNKDDDKNNVTPFPSRKQRETRKQEKIKILEIGNSNIKQDNVPIFNVPPTSKALVLIMIAVHMAFFIGGYLIPEYNWTELKNWFAFIPASYLDFNNLGIKELISPITSMFLHDDFFHLILNMAILVAIGSGFEKVIGGKKMLIIFFITGFMGTLFHFVMFHNQFNPVMGASGGISGLLGAFLMQNQMTGRMGYGYKKLAMVAGVFTLISLVFVLIESSVAWAVHLGGFWAGLFLYKKILFSKFGR